MPLLKCAQLCNDLYAEEIAKYRQSSSRLSVPYRFPTSPRRSRKLADACTNSVSPASASVLLPEGSASAVKQLYPLWEFLDDERSVVFVHPVGSPDTFTSGMEAYMLGPKFGGPHEAGLAGIHLVVSGVTRRFPDIKWILAPMGGTMLYLWRRFEEISHQSGPR